MSVARLRRAGSWAVVLVIVAGWFVTLRPQALGGPAMYLTVSGTSMRPGLKSGDVVMVTRRSSYRRGDVIAFRIPRGRPGAGHVVLHRIVGGDGAGGFQTRGDNRTTDDRWRPRASDVVGTRAVRIPMLASAARLVLTPVGLGLIAGLLVTISIAAGPRRDPAEVAAPPAPQDGPQQPVAARRPRRRRRRRTVKLMLGAAVVAFKLLAGARG